MRNKVDFKTLSGVNEVFGDFEVGQTFGSGDVYLRFGYWKQVDVDKLNEVLGVNNVVEDSWNDDDCGWLYSYNFI